MALRPIDGGACFPVAIIRDETSGATLQPTADANLLAELQKKADLTETQPTKITRQTLATTDHHAPADNTAAVITYTGIAAVYHVIGQISWGYDADPTGGLLTIENSTGIVFTLPITKGGPGQFTFNPPITTGVAADLKITLAAAGGTVQGYVNATHWLEA
jgi:hypothetical protein